MKLIYIPIEVKTRELLSKLFFIANNINENFVFFIGDKMSTRSALSLFGKGIYFYKSINWYDLPHIKRVKNRGNAYISLDEEGGATQSNKSSFKSLLDYRSSEENISLVDRVFTWGNFDYKGWCREYKNYKKKIFKTGSPRFDLWRNQVYSKIFKEEISNLQKYTPYIFIPSTFVSSKKILKKVISDEKNIKKTNSKITSLVLKKRIKSLEDSYKNYIVYVKLIKKLTKDFPNYNIIVKPHPTENLYDWQKKFALKKYSNVLVNNDFDLTSYIAAAESVIFSESTAGIQSIIMGKKAISYNIKSNVTFRNFANKCAPQATNYKILLKYLNKKVFYKQHIYRKKIQNRYHISKTTSSKIIMKNIKNIKINRINIKLLKLKVMLLNPFYVIIHNLKFLKARIRKIILKIETNYKSYESKMQGGIEKNEIEKFFKCLRLKNKVEIIKFGKNGFIIHKKNIDMN
tara:strand:- start:22101 stop:23480 length:1380 start_codon:yes stop_codon:yes gene_type:complete